MLNQQRNNPIPAAFVWMINRGVAFLLLVPFASAQFYVRDQPYRLGAKAFEDHHDFSVNFIEIKDCGFNRDKPCEPFFDRAQVSRALEQIEKARFDGKQKPIVLIYIHGWHNNAREIAQKTDANCSDHPYNGDVAKFRECGLRPLAEMYPTVSGAPPRVVGIYLAWHGNDFNWPGFNIIPSYPIRRSFARKVGEFGMDDALHQIVDQIASGGHRNDYFVIAMGHSFGSRVLETAAEKAISPHKPKTGFMLQYRSGLKDGPTLSDVAASNPRPPIDLIFHVNAASSHSISLATIKEWDKACASSHQPAGCAQSPLYLAVSSRADILTALVMPIANVVFFAPTTDQYHLISAANTPWIQTHKIPKAVEACSNPYPPDSFCFDVTDPVSKEVVASYEVQPKKGKVPARFWAMNSDHWIAAPEAMLHSIPVFRKLVNHHWLISSHGDVWNPGVFALVQGAIKQESQKRDF